MSRRSESPPTTQWDWPTPTPPMLLPLLLATPPLLLPLLLLLACGPASSSSPPLLSPSLSLKL